MPDSLSLLVLLRDISLRVAHEYRAKQIVQPSEDINTTISQVSGKKYANRQCLSSGGNIVSCDFPSVARYCAARTQTFLKMFRNVLLCSGREVCVHRECLRAWQNEATFEKHALVTTYVAAATMCPRFPGA